MKKIACIILIVLTGNIVQAQNDSIFDAFNKEFEEYRKAADVEFDTYKSKSDSVFLNFLEETWREFEVFRHTPPVRSKPKEQPVIKEQPDTIQQKLETAPLSSDINKQTGQPIDIGLKKIAPINYESRIIAKSINIYGSDLKIYYYPDKLPKLTKVDEESITNFYRNLAYNNSVWNYNINEFKKLKETCHFNDWGYYIILMNAAKSIFDTKNEQTLFIWYVFIKSGYKIKVGYNDSELYLLLPSQQKLYNVQYLSENGLQYYLFHSGKNQPVQIKTYPGFYTDDAKIFSFRLSELPKLTEESIEKHQLFYNKKVINLEFNSGSIDFFNSFPQCELNIYFESPISFKNIDALDKIFVPILNGKSDREKVDILLNFIQSAIMYKTDQEQFGKERYMFAEECLYYPYSDCEDRAILLGQLVKHYTGLPTIGLNFPDHVTLAVQFPVEINGNYVIFEGEKYFICDPTYINAKSGMIPADLKNKKPKVIVF